MIRACVFDLGGVVLDFDFGRFFRKILPHCRPETTPEGLERLAAERNNALEKGHISFCAYYLRFKEELGLRLDLEEFTLAWNDIFTENWETIHLLPRLEAVRLFLLSNTNEAHAGWFQSRFGEVLGLFEKCFFSHELGEMKPSLQVFRAVEKADGLRPEEHLLIDDLEEHIRGARKAGWQAIRFEGAAALEESLRSLGVIPRATSHILETVERNGALQDAFRREKK